MLFRSWIEHIDGRQHQHATLHIHVAQNVSTLLLGQMLLLQALVLQLFAANGWRCGFYKHISSPANHINSQEGWLRAWTGRHSLLSICTDAGITPCAQPQQAPETSEIHLPCHLDGNTLFAARSVPYTHLMCTITMHCTWISSETVHHYTDCITPKVW